MTTGVSTDIDTAGALMIASQSKIKIAGQNVIVHGDLVTPHGPPPHLSATMIAGGSKVVIAGIPVVIENDSATCGDIATGSSKVKIG